eukprot:3264536-Lingulodinium_polyedra.AAC.1
MVVCGVDLQEWFEARIAGWHLRVDRVAVRTFRAVQLPPPSADGRARACRCAGVQHLLGLQPLC